jgi:hypothetical protein
MDKFPINVSTFDVLIFDVLTLSRKKTVLSINKTGNHSTRQTIVKDYKRESGLCFLLKIIFLVNDIRKNDLGLLKLKLQNKDKTFLAGFSLR